MIADGLEGRIRRAYRLAFLEELPNVPVGVGALKSPGAEYVKSKFEAASVSSLAAGYHLELGWIVVVERLRGQGLSYQICESLLVGVEGDVFATVREDNTPLPAWPVWLAVRGLGSSPKHSSGLVLDAGPQFVCCGQNISPRTRARHQAPAKRRWAPLALSS